MFSLFRQVEYRASNVRLIIVFARLSQVVATRSLGVIDNFYQLVRAVINDVQFGDRVNQFPTRNRLF